MTEGQARTRRDLFRVGVFVLVAGAVLAGGLLWIAGAHLFRHVDTYTILFTDSVTGETSPGRSAKGPNTRRSSSSGS